MLLYELLLYKKKNIIAIQEKLSINSNTNQIALNQSEKGKTLKDLFGLLFDLVKKLKITDYFILIILHQNIQDLIEATFKGKNMSFGKIYHLLLYLE